MCGTSSYIMSLANLKEDIFMPPKTKGILKKSGRRIDRKNGNVNVEVSPATERNKVRYSKVAQEGFTKDEIKAIVDRHKFLVEDMNKYLPEGQKLSVDKDLEKKLQDPKLARMYRLGTEIKEKSIKQKEIYQDLRKKYGEEKKIEGFYIFDSFKTGNTEEDKIYNEQLFRNYKDNPEKFAYEQFNKVVNTSGKELYDLGNDPIKQAEYYLNNQQKCNAANSLKTAISSEKNQGLFTDTYKKYANSIGSVAKLIYQPKEACKKYDSIDKLAFPQLNEKQAGALDDVSYGFKINENEDIHTGIKNAKYHWDDAEVSAKEKMDKLKEATGVDLSNNEKLVSDTIFYNDKGEVMDVNEMFHKYLDNEKFGSAAPITDPNEKRDIGYITNNFKNSYMNNWRASFNKKMGINGNKIDVKGIEEKNKGSFLNRLFRRESKEYKEMMNAFKEYNDPKSKNYMNKDNLDVKTQAYVNHKTAKGKELTAGDKLRMDFAKNILDTSKESDKIFHQTENQFVNKPQKRVTFLLPEEVNVEGKEKEKANVKVNEGPEQNKQKEEGMELE